METKRGRREEERVAGRTGSLGVQDPYITDLPPLVGTREGGREGLGQRIRERGREGGRMGGWRQQLSNIQHRLKVRLHPPTKSKKSLGDRFWSENDDFTRG